MVVLLLALLYIVSPVDIIPDVIPVVGWADDAVVELVAAAYALNLKSNGENPERRLRQ